MKNQLRKLSKSRFALMLCSALILLSCSDDKDIAPSVNEQWGATLIGNDGTVAAYPDLYVNYWVYAYNTELCPNIGLKVTGKYPHARFFSFTLYDDNGGDAIGGMADYELKADPDCVNPYIQTSSKDNTYTMYIVPKNFDMSSLGFKDASNICEVDMSVPILSLCLREYLGTDEKNNYDEFGGVDLPKIEAFDLTTGKDVKVPDRVLSKVYNLPVNIYVQESDKGNEVPFFLATKGQYFPNNSSDYLYGRTTMDDDQVLLIKFIPAPIPQKVEDYEQAKARYWSICLGSALNTYSYYSIYDKQVDVPENEPITIVVDLAQNPDTAAISKKVHSLKNHYLITWDREKLDCKNKAIGNTIAFMYRNILPNKDWPYSMANMTPTAYVDPITKVEDPTKQIAHKALGEYGPYGCKFKTSEFLSDDFNFVVPY